MPNTVLVTGGAGFIGSHVVDLLLERGDRVRVYDSLVDQVHGADAPRFLATDAEFVRADVRDRDRLQRALAGIDQVVHLAAEVGVGQSMYEVSRYVDANTSGTGRLLDILANEHHSVRKVVVASSMSVYGEGQYECADHGAQFPTLRSPEQLGRHRWEHACPVCAQVLHPRPTAEGKPLRPTSVYAISKMDQELLVLSVCGAYGIGATAVRYFNAYGPRQALSNPYTGVAAIFSGRLMAGQAPIIMEDGLQRRDFVHVRDVARATVAALDSTAANGHAINIGTGEPVTISEVAALIAAELGAGDIAAQITDMYRAGDIRHCWADVTLARDLLGFEAEYRFAGTGVKDLVAWVARESVDAQPDPTLELARRGLTS